MSAVEVLARHVPLTSACAALGVARSSLYRTRQAICRPVALSRVPTPPAWALSQAEREHIRGVLHSPEFVDLAPRAVWARLLDQGVYLCSWRTMYRLLAEQGQVRERRAVRPPRAFVRPELGARGPREVWSWDITRLLGLVKGQFFYLYVILDIFSRYVVGFLVADHESHDLARQLVAQTATKEGIAPGSLTLHADRGGPMVALSMHELLAVLGIHKSHSRPRVSNDNPYSEAHFKTLKYGPDAPRRFRTLDEARQWARQAINAYNHAHAHSALALLTPATVHAGRAASVLATRQTTLDAAFDAHPQRFPHGRPDAGRLPDTVWINAPAALDLPAPSSPVSPAPPAPIQVTTPSAQAGSRADAPSPARPAQRTLDPDEHSAIRPPLSIPEIAAPQ